MLLSGSSHKKTLPIQIYPYLFPSISYRVINMADNTIESFLSSLNFVEEYLQRFKDSGFDDLELIKSLDTEEKQQMFEVVGLSRKPGHLLKFKKGLCSLEPPSTIQTSRGPAESLRNETTTATKTSKSASFIKQGRKSQTSK